MTVPPTTIAPHLLPTHVGVVMDGNRRWAKKAGFTDPGRGHDVGADHVADLLGWCTHWRIDHLTSYVLSADNIRKRPKSQIDHLFGILTEKLPQTVVRSDRWPFTSPATFLCSPTRQRARCARLSRRPPVVPPT